MEPSKVILTGKWATQSVLVTAKLADGALRDLTAQAQFKSARSKTATVTKAGVITPIADGATVVSVAIRGFKKTTVPVTVVNFHNTTASFLNQVRPLLGKLGCNSAECHGAGKGRGGLRLSLFGGLPHSPPTRSSCAAFTWM